MAGKTRSDEQLASIRRAKEAYIEVLRQAFMQGLDPSLLVETGLMNLDFQAPCREGVIDLVDDRELANPNVVNYIT